MDENSQAPQPSAPQQPTPQPQMQQPMGSAPQPGMPAPKNKMPMIVGIIVAVLVLAGAVAYGVYAYVTNTPDYLLSRATDQLGKQDAYAATFKVQTGTSSNGATFSGDFAIKGDKANKSAEAVVGLGTGDSRVALSVMTFTDALYMKATSLDHLGNLVKQFAPDQAVAYDTPEAKAAFQRIDGQWFTLSKEDVQGLAQSTSQQPSTDVTGSVNVEDMQKVLSAYNKHPFFKADKTYADDTVDGVKSAHFTIKIDATNLKAFMNEIKADNLSSIKVTDEDIANADKDLADFNKNVSVDFWITRDSKQFKQFKFTSLQQGSEGSVTVTLVTNLPQFDPIAKPSNAKPFSDLMMELLGPSASELDSTSGL